jgi:phosphatidylglycerophosphate synthase
LSTSTSTTSEPENASKRSSTPTIAELRAATQPPSLFERNSGEHWTGRLYMRRLSPYVTRLILPTRISADAVTGATLVAGLAAAALLTLPGLIPAAGAVLLIQAQMLLDCSDGEVARWRGEKSTVGVYLDRIGHWLTEAALPIALGIRTGDDTYVMLGLVASVLVLLIKGESALVTVARAEAGLPPAADTVAVAAPRHSLLRSVRRLLGFVPFYRAFVAVEATLLALAAEIFGLTEELVIALVAITAITAAGHLLAIVTSTRLR